MGGEDVLNLDMVLQSAITCKCHLNSIDQTDLSAKMTGTVSIYQTRQMCIDG